MKKKQGGEGKTLWGCKSGLPSGFVSLLNWRVMMPANTIKYVSLNVGRRRKYVPPNVGRKNVSMNASWSETVTGVQRDFAEKSWSLQIMRFQESSRRVEIFQCHCPLRFMQKNLLAWVSTTCFFFFGALGGSKDVMGVRWERLPSVYSQTFLLLKLLRAATKHFHIVQDAKKIWKQ